MYNRIPLYPGRVKLTPVGGDLYDMERADQPTQEGTPLNKATLLSDETAAKIWKNPTGAETVSEALAQLPSFSRITETHPVAEGYSVNAGDVVDVNEAGEVANNQAWVVQNKYSLTSNQTFEVPAVQLSDDLVVARNTGSVFAAIDAAGNYTEISSRYYVATSSGKSYVTRINDTSFITCLNDTSGRILPAICSYSGDSWEFHEASLSDGMTYDHYDGSFAIYPILVIGNIAYIGFTETYPKQKVWIYTFDISTGTPTKLQSLLLRGADSPGSLYSMGLAQVDENHLLALTYGEYGGGGPFTETAQVYELDGEGGLTAVGTPAEHAMNNGDITIGDGYEGSYSIANGVSAITFSIVNNTIRIIYNTPYTIDEQYNVTRNASTNIFSFAGNISDSGIQISVSSKGDVLVGSSFGESSTGELCALYKPADSETFEPLSNILTLPDFCFATISPSGDTIFVADSTTTYNLLKVKTDSSYAIALSDAEAGQNVEIALEGLFDLPGITKGQEILDANGYRIGYGYADGKLRVESNVLQKLPCVTGSYTGGGTYGSANPNRLELGFRPSFVMIYSNGNYSRAFLGSYKGAYTLGSTTTALTSVTFDSTGVSWYYSAPLQQMNVSGVVYDYVAFR